MINGKWLMKYLVLAGLFGSVFGTRIEAQKLAKDQPPEQTSFGAEALPGEVLVKEPVEIPVSALQVLRDTLSQGTIECIKNLEGLTPEQVQASWFVASKIHLDGPSETDLIVEPADMRESPSPNRCLFGAHAVPFWILRNTGGKYELLLETYADCLTVLDSRTNGYRDIQVLSLTAVTTTTAVFKFTVSQYKIAERKTEAAGAR